MIFPVSHGGFFQYEFEIQWDLSNPHNKSEQNSDVHGFFPALFFHPFFHRSGAFPMASPARMDEATRETADGRLELLPGLPPHAPRFFEED